MSPWVEANEIILPQKGFRENKYFFLRSKQTFIFKHNKKTTQ